MEISIIVFLCVVRVLDVWRASSTSIQHEVMDGPPGLDITIDNDVVVAANNIAKKNY